MIGHEKQEELREIYKQRLKMEKQKWIAETTGINMSVLSRFKHRKIDLYDYLFVKLEKYLLGQ